MFFGALAIAVVGGIFMFRESKLFRAVQPPRLAVAQLFCNLNGDPKVLLVVASATHLWITFTSVIIRIVKIRAFIPGVCIVLVWYQIVGALAGTIGGRICHCLVLTTTIIFTSAATIGRVEFPRTRFSREFPFIFTPLLCLADGCYLIWTPLIWLAFTSVIIRNVNTGAFRDVGVVVRYEIVKALAGTI